MDFNQKLKFSTEEKKFPSHDYLLIRVSCPIERLTVYKIVTNIKY